MSVNLKQYFTEQLKEAPPITEQDIANFIKARVDRGVDETTVTEYFNSKLGQRLVFAMVESNKGSDGKVEVIRYFEDELESKLSGYTFDGMSGRFTPRFKKLN